jgi:glycosyltransferase involved in cell wall biosynthesis
MQMKGKKVSVIIPVFNEEQSVGKVVESVFDSLGEEVQVVVVDDGSTDGSAAAAREAGALVVQHPYNIGNGAAVKTGIRNSQGEVLVMMDADGQHRPEEIMELLRYIPAYDMVVGARGRGSQAGIHRSLANRIYNALATYVSSFKVPDLTSGFRAVKRECALRCIHLLPNGFSYPATITLALLKLGLSVKYVPINAPARKGKSKISPARDGIRFFLIIIKIATLFSPLRIFLPVSIAFFILGLAYYIYTFLMYHRFTNMSVLLFITSVIIFMLGLVAEQVAQLRMDLGYTREERNF